MLDILQHYGNTQLKRLYITLKKSFVSHYYYNINIKPISY